MSNKREYIQLPRKVTIFIVLTPIVILIGVILVSQFTPRPHLVNQSTEIRMVKITTLQNRGSVEINDTLFIHSSSKLIFLPEGFDGWLNHGPISDFDTIPYVFTLGDLKTPYFLKKEENNDTIVINKDGYTLFFKLYPETNNIDTY